MDMLILILVILGLLIWVIETFWWVFIIAAIIAIIVVVVSAIVSKRETKYLKDNLAKAAVDKVQYTIIKETDYYEDRLEPAWIYPDPNDQWLFAETIREYVGTKYDILYVFADNTYIERCGLREVPPEAMSLSRSLNYDETKRRLKKRGF